LIRNAASRWLVCKDFFDYLPAPAYDDGVQMRDMLMLRLNVAEAAAR
jgi:hypothetical protein